jgi:ATP-dependent DNA ligase
MSFLYTESGTRRPTAACSPTGGLALCRAAEETDWLHEMKSDGHRLVAVIEGRDGLKLISRDGIDRTALFRGPLEPSLEPVVR